MRVELSREQIEQIADAVAKRIKVEPSESIPVSRFAEKRLLSLKDGADYLGAKNADAVRHMVNSGSIPQSVVKRVTNRRIFLDRIELDKWITAQ